jgi:hypothetical protein
MIEPDPAGNRQSPFNKERTYGAVRTILITYGVAASSYLSAQSVPDGVAVAYGGIFTARSLVVLGLVLQLLMIGVRMLVRHKAPDAGAAAQGLLILELVGDGVTVLLFALGTFGVILNIADI